MFFDTHAHLDDARFDDDREAVIASLGEKCVTRVINASSDMKSSLETVALCEKYPFIFGAVGVHPHSAAEMNDSDIEAIAELTNRTRICAIGEIGLDYYYDTSPRDIQKKRFADQLALASELGLPVVIHDRDAHRDCLDILKRFTGVRAVYHCFSGSVEYAREVLALGCYLSFNGALTFKNAVTAPEVVRSMPRDRLMIETDCPYLTPVPYRGKRNDPGFVPLVAAKVAELLGESIEEIARLTFENGNRFFGL